jgi:hypothetical protein
MFSCLQLFLHTFFPLWKICKKIVFHILSLKQNSSYKNVLCQIMCFDFMEDMTTYYVCMHGRLRVNTWTWIFFKLFFQYF